MEQAQDKRDNQKLWPFFAIAYAFSWLFWVPKALIAQGLGVPPIASDFLNGPFNPAAFGPFVAAFYLTYRNDGKTGVVALLRRGVDLKFNKAWLVPILLLMPAITGGALLIARLLGDNSADLTVLFNPGLILYWFGYMLLLGGPLQEEFGWRGYALDRLQARHSALKSSLILGLIWALWHLPLNLTTEVGPQYSVVLSMLIGSIITIVLLSVFFTWIYNNTGRSVLAVLLFHASLNLSTFKLFPIFEASSAVPFYLLLVLISVIFVVLIWGRKTLVRPHSTAR